MDRETLSKLSELGIGKQYLVEKNKKHVVLECNEWPFPFKIEKKPFLKTLLKLYCTDCLTYHMLTWGEVKLGLESLPLTAQALINLYAYKYCTKIKDSSSNLVNPADLLSVCNARKVADPRFEIPEHLVSMAKNLKSQRLQKLWKDMEAQGVDVRDVAYEGKGIYTCKFVTPIGGYLISGSKEELIAVIEEDIEAFHSCRCPFCDQTYDPLSRDFLGNGTCLSCAALVGSIGKNLANCVTQEIQSRVDPNLFLVALRFWDDIYHDCPKTGYAWIDINGIAKKAGQWAFPSYEHKKDDVQTTLFYFEDDDTERIAGCRYCERRLEAYSHRHQVADLYCNPCEDIGNFEKVVSFEFGFKQHFRFDSEEPLENIIWDAIFDQFLSLFIDCRDISLKGFCPQKGRHYSGICSRFVLDERKLEFEKDDIERQESVTIQFTEGLHAVADGSTPMS